MYTATVYTYFNMQTLFWPGPVTGSFWQVGRRETEDDRNILRGRRVGPAVTAPATLVPPLPVINEVSREAAIADKPLDLE